MKDLKVKWPWIRVDTNPKCPYKRQNRKRDHTGGSHVTIEAAIHAAMMSLQAKKCWAWPAAASTGREAGNKFSPRVPRREQPATTVMPDFLRTVNK